MVLFPEGSRGEAEQMVRFKAGVYFLAKSSGAQVVPLAIAGLGVVMPRHSHVPLPMNCEVVCGDAMTTAEFEADVGSGRDDEISDDASRDRDARNRFLNELQQRVVALRSEANLVAGFLVDQDDELDLLGEQGEHRQ